MPVADHIDMLNSQFLLNTLRPDHPSHAVVTVPPGHRRMKATLTSKYHDSIHQHLVNGSTDPSAYKSNLKTIHTDSVAASIQRLGVNPLLGDRPPEISPSERRLHCEP